MDQHGFCEVASVNVVQTHSVVTIRVYDADGCYNEFTIKANAAHVGCMGLSVDRQYHAKQEPDWVDLEQANAISNS